MGDFRGRQQRLRIARHQRSRAGVLKSSGLSSDSRKHLFSRLIRLVSRRRSILAGADNIGCGAQNRRWGEPDAPEIPGAFSAGERRWWREELACGHDVMLDMPNELTALLLQRS